MSAGRRLSAMLDALMAAVGRVRSAPAEPRRRPAQPVYPAALRQEEELRARMDVLAAELGFEVGPDGLWRHDGLVVVAEPKPALGTSDHDLPGRIDALRSDGRIGADDEVRGIYVYAAETAAVQTLFEAMSDGGRRSTQLRLLRLQTLAYLAEEVTAGRMPPADARALLFADSGIDVGGWGGP